MYSANREDKWILSDVPDCLRWVAPRHFLLDGNLFPFEVETPIKS